MTIISLTDDHDHLSTRIGQYKKNYKTNLSTKINVKKYKTNLSTRISFLATSQCSKRENSNLKKEFGLEMDIMLVNGIGHRSCQTTIATTMFT